MKKSVLALALAFGVTTAFAQDLTSKKGEPILPEAGDWGLSIDATPILSYAHNFIGTGGSSTITWNSLTSPLTITGKYFTDEKTAYRGSVSLGFGSQSWSRFAADQDNFTGTGTVPKVEDKKKTSNSGVWLAGGIEMRKGKTRLQGYYGGEVGIGFSGTKDTYTYGNAFSSTNTSPTSADWASSSATATTSGARTLSNKAGSTIQFGLRGFIGAEYFVLAKMSIGGEFGWGLGFSSTGQGETVTESWNGASNAVQSTTTKTGKSGSFNLGADNKNTVFGPAGAVKLNLYF